MNVANCENKLKRVFLQTFLVIFYRTVVRVCQPKLAAAAAVSVAAAAAVEIRADGVIQIICSREDG